MRGSRMKARGDLEDLALRERERAGERARVDPVHVVAARAPRRAWATSLRRWIRRLAPRGSLPTNEVLRDRHPREQRQLLEDHADAVAACRGCDRVA